MDLLREAGVVDAGGAGLVELLRGVAAAVAGTPVPESSAAAEPAHVEAIHLEPSRFRYCTVFVVEGEVLDRDALEERLQPLGDSLLVVGDDTALKVHVHTDDPGAALSLGTAAGTIEGVEIANMHEQQEQRERRLSLVPKTQVRSGVVAVVACSSRSPKGSGRSGSSKAGRPPTPPPRSSSRRSRGSLPTRRSSSRTTRTCGSRPSTRREKRIYRPPWCPRCRFRPASPPSSHTTEPAEQRTTPRR
jgi:hypothetical protein